MSLANYKTRETDKLLHYQRLQTDLKYFFYHLAAPVLMGGENIFKPSRGFEIMAEHLVAMLAGDIKRLGIAIPPRNGKSLLISTSLPMWEWLTNPNSTFISVAHHDDLLKQFQTGRQTIFRSEEYQNSVDFTLTTNTSSEFRNSQSGHVLSMVMDYVKTGLGGDILMVDDPMPARNSNNLAACEKVWRLYTSTLLSRLNNKKEGKIVVVSQRLCDQDIIGHVIESGYTVLTLQAIADEPQTLIFPLSGQIWERPTGDILNPDLEPLEVLMEIKATDKNTFQSQYQQRPLAIKGNILEIENLGSYKKPEDSYEEIIVSVDSASSTSAVSANWGITVFGKHYLEGILHLDLLYCHAAKYDYVQGMKKIKEIYEDRGGSIFMVENKSTGLAIIPSLKDDKDEKGERKYKVIEIQPVKSKEDRAMAAAPFLNKGRLRVPDVSDLPFTERWLSLFLYEVEGFGGAAARKCDLVDSTSQCVNYYYSGNTFNAKNFFKLN